MTPVNPDGTNHGVSFRSFAYSRASVGLSVLGPGTQTIRRRYLNRAGQTAA